MIGLETARLQFRQWAAQDVNAFYDFFADPVGTRFVGGQKSQEDAWRLMATYMGHYQLLGYSYLAVEEIQTKQLIGAVGLWNSDPWPEPELGYWILPRMQGKGFASEAAQALKQFAFESLNIPTLVSYIDPENTASKKVALKAGAQWEGDIQLLQFGLHEVYRYRA